MSGKTLSDVEIFLKKIGEDELAAVVFRAQLVVSQHEVVCTRHEYSGERRREDYDEMTFWGFAHG